MFLFGVLLALAAELVAFIAVGRAIGFFSALVLLIAVSALGPFVVRRVGFGVLAQTRARLARGEVPTTELLDGILVFVGGVMICVPGFIGDGLGLLLMAGPVRHMIIRAGGHRLARRVARTRSRLGPVIDVTTRSGHSEPWSPNLPDGSEGRHGPE